MPNFKDYTKRQLARALNEIAQAIYTVVDDLSVRAWCTHEPLPYAERFTGEERALSIGDKWGDLFDSAWFHFTGRIPESAAGQCVVLLLDVNGEMCIFDDQGVPVRGLTTVTSTYDYSLGKPGKRVYRITTQAKGGERINVWADAGCNDLFGNIQGNGTLKEAAIAICNEEVRALYYDFEVLLDFLNALPADTPRYQQILTGLNDVAHLLHNGVAATATQARAILTPLLAKRGGDPSLSISAVGHAHMDLAWLWPIRETIRKGARTFSTALTLMDRYPDYVLGASQAQYFLWMKEHYPTLYAKVKKKIAEGRLEAQGAMWVEADTNVPSGEALVRQVLQGKRFFSQEFGVDIHYLWLPDAFGYSAALPQILKKSGVEVFSTQKLSWSLINKFPHQSFHWQGIDGTTVLTHMLPEETYNSPAAPRSVRKIESNYRDSGVSSHSLLVFGIGDGGGGPGEEHLERLTRIKNLAGLSPVTQEPVVAFIEKWQSEAERFPTWVGELYLERHQGTLTTEGRNKWYNRKIELALRELEWAASLAWLLSGEAYPDARLEVIWREVLLYQFHDILPGSSIKRVYDESLDRYQALMTEVSHHLDRRDALLARQINTAEMTAPVVVWNSLSWERAAWVRAGDQWLYANVPPMGYQAIDSATEPTPHTSPTATETTLENDVLRVDFAPDGSIAHIFDKREQRQVLAEGERGNRLMVYRDLGDAWDFPMDYAEQTPRAMTLVASTPRVDGPQATLTQVYRLGHSELRQDIVLTAGSPRLDFVTHLRWREPQAMLRTQFPVAVHTESATFEIQFGHIQRPTHQNTTWDLARDEVAAHKWVDLSQRDYGVALLNDAKYGHRVKGNVIDLNLLRSVPYPGPRLVQDADVEAGAPHHAYTDQCDHTFTYALYPHPGDVIAGGVVQAGYALNVPLRVVPTTVHTGPQPATAFFLRVDAPNVIVDTVKKAEEEDDLIIRLYEAAKQHTQTTLHFGFPVTAAAETTLMEDPIAPLALADNAVTLTFKPFEIKTIKVKRDQLRIAGDAK